MIELPGHVAPVVDEGDVKLDTRIHAATVAFWAQLARRCLVLQLVQDADVTLALDMRPLSTIVACPPWSVRATGCRIGCTTLSHSGLMNRHSRGCCFPGMCPLLLISKD